MNMPNLQTDVALADYLSWKTGGRAKQFFQPKDMHDLAKTLAKLPDQEALLWLGLGSNLLVRDGGFNGTVIFTQKTLKAINVLANRQIRVEVGVACPSLARFAAKQDLAGGEWFAGIPGTVGGALAMNAGAFGGETWQHVINVETIDRQGNIHVRYPHEFTIAYRQVHYQRQEWFVAATLAFEAGNKQTGLAMIKTLLAKRASSQPTGVPTCGSVFRNPAGDYAARLIEACGLKGYRKQHVMVSDKHANFIVNLGNASAADIEQLIHQVAQTVKQQCQVTLQPEVKIVGDTA